MDRREFLALCGAGVGFGALAGCSGDPRDADSPGSAPLPSPTGTPPETSTGTPPTVDPLDGSWESYRHDAANTAATDDPGPTAEPTEVWRRPTTTGEPATPPAAADGAFVLVTRSGVVYARAAADGSVRWSSDRTADAEVSPVATDGTERWRTGVGNDLVLAVGDGGVYGVTYDTPVLAFDAEDGDLLWRHGGSEWTTPPAVAGEYLSLGDGAGRVPPSARNRSDVDRRSQPEGSVRRGTPVAWSRTEDVRVPR